MANLVAREVLISRLINREVEQIPIELTPAEVKFVFESVNLAGNGDLKNIIVIQKADIPGDFLIVAVDVNGVFKSTAPGNVQTWEHGEENGWKTANTQTVSLLPLEVKSEPQIE